MPSVFSVLLCSAPPALSSATISLLFYLMIRNSADILTGVLITTALWDPDMWKGDREGGDER